MRFSLLEHLAVKEKAAALATLAASFPVPDPLHSKGVVSGVRKSLQPQGETALRLPRMFKGGAQRVSCRGAVYQRFYEMGTSKSVAVPFVSERTRTHRLTSLEGCREGEPLGAFR